MEIFEKLPDIIKINTLSFRPIHPISKIFKDKINEIPHSHKKDFIFEYKLFLDFLLGFFGRDNKGNIDFLCDLSFKRISYIKYSILYDLYKYNKFYKEWGTYRLIKRYNLSVDNGRYIRDLELNEIFTLLKINHKDLLFRNYEFNGKIKNNTNYIKYLKYLYKKK